jgi:hypothetical protein
MTDRMTTGGVSTCQTAGTEKYESFQSGIGKHKRTLVQYDYRHHSNGKFSHVSAPHGRSAEPNGDDWFNKRLE